MLLRFLLCIGLWQALNESPSEKEGKSFRSACSRSNLRPSMKVPPKRKGNFLGVLAVYISGWALNESPSEKEGK